MSSPGRTILSGFLFVTSLLFKSGKEGGSHGSFTEAIRSIGTADSRIEAPHPSTRSAYPYSRMTPAVVASYDLWFGCAGLLGSATSLSHSAGGPESGATCRTTRIQARACDEWPGRNNYKRSESAHCQWPGRYGHQEWAGQLDRGLQRTPPG